MSLKHVDFSFISVHAPYSIVQRHINYGIYDVISKESQVSFWTHIQHSIIRIYLHSICKISMEEQEKEKRSFLKHEVKKRVTKLGCCLVFVLTCTFIIISVNFSSKRNGEGKKKIIKISHLAEMLHLLPHSLIPLAQESVPRPWSKSTEVRDFIGSPCSGAWVEVGVRDCSVFPEDTWKDLTTLEYLVCR